jgi:hypothetical protein
MAQHLKDLVELQDQGILTEDGKRGASEPGLPGEQANLLHPLDRLAA